MLSIPERETHDIEICTSNYAHGVCLAAACQFLVGCGSILGMDLTPEPIEKAHEIGDLVCFRNFPFSIWDPLCTQNLQKTFIKVCALIKVVCLFFKVFI